MIENIRNIYYEYQDMFDTFLDIEIENDDTDRRFYVYEWYCNDKIFYVGKGTGKRYNHIWEEADLYERNNKKYKGERWSKLRKAYGINYKFVETNLTEEEALILELYCIVDRMLKREPLLNHIIPWGWCGLNEELEKYWHDVNYGKDLLKYFGEIND